MRLKDLLVGLAIMCLWGFNFSVIKLGADQINPIVLTTLRFTFAVLPVIFFIRYPRVKLRYLIGYGITFGVGVWGMMTSAISLGVSAGMAGVLMDLSLISSLLIGWFVLKERITIRQYIGAVLILIGVLASLGLQDGSVPLAGLLLVLIGAISWSVIGLIVKLAKPEQVFAFSVWGMLFAPAPLALLALMSYGPEVFTNLPAQMNASVWFSVLFQAYPTTLLGYWVWNRLIAKYPLSTVAPLTMLTPVFGMLGSMLFHGELVDNTKLLACGFILLGFFIGQWQQNWFKRQTCVSSGTLR
ncbi:Permease of the drug/metabolite transporter (DMT) superfamily [Nitrincola lacisaponensis]|uniref:Permease of the drug/metabolite transporter (DMT) superfamily n=1 Tax=Nitrincola lacisaponensis TaxID=267850 RepID=A0A063Y2H8_9GAMM|nr:EamA family transporter [Nitrincola lacisaponensis]KDE39889.1 Permease of the drug/metabolite transporter (DMT) superfamily [Nitrincola lacisaponensis]